ncbi:MAG TPA: NAD(P)/FAD-dependent oxidoreductase [Brevefilum sp.]|nr:NAD(P)/FAD-dependent oxidoreductase [Brevefilum sp.]HOR18792.1 NAD(P)/FAD-dependent oxidoreductase [Brevefilum sp.]HPL68693.1 NAD(P)/FAD-dependent oxidoreductase [Brevefilum sp.]
MQNYDVIVVGAGPGGTTVASLLANSGKKVLLIDKNQKPGGRMMTINRDGFSYELFPINCVPQHDSLFEKLSQTLGKENHVKLILGDDFGIGKLFYENREGEITSWQMGLKFPGVLKMFGFIGVKPWQLRSIFQIARVVGKLRAMDETEISALYNVSAMEYLDSLGPMPAGFRTFMLASFGEGAFEMTSDRVAAGEMVRMFQETFSGSGGRYYEGGVGHFFEVMAQTVEEKGGKVRMNARVESINTWDGSVCGITTQTGETYTAPVVISNAGIRQTVLKLVGEDKFETDYVERIKSLESNLACVGYRYFTSRPVLTSPMMVLFPEGCVAKYSEFEAIAHGEAKPENGYIYLGTTSLYPNMAPVDKQVVYAVVSCLPALHVESKPCLEYIEKGVRKIAPELYEPDVITHTEIMTTAIVPSVGNDAILPGQGGESYGIANSIGQAGPHRPKGDTPISGLYIVGNDTEGFGLGTHQAVDSGFKVYEKVVAWLDN